MTTNDPRDHALRVLLEEKVGGATSPDLTARILERAARSDLPPCDTDRQLGAHIMIPAHESFETIAVGNAQHGVVREFVAFMADNSKWWLLPFLLVFGLLGIAVLLGSTGAAPFIYTLF